MHAKRQVDDKPGVDISSSFEACNKFIEAARLRGERVLVHCFEGRSRSATLVVQYLMQCQHMDLRTAFKLVKGVRPHVNPNAGCVTRRRCAPHAPCCDSSP